MNTKGFWLTVLALCAYAAVVAGSRANAVVTADYYVEFIAGDPRRDTAPSLLLIRPHTAHDTPICVTRKDAQPGEDPRSCVRLSDIEALIASEGGDPLSMRWRQ
jgi:hypothetical protein